MSALLRIVVGGLVAALVAVSILLTAPTAKAHMLICGERRDFINQLEKQYDEKRAVVGLTSNGRLIEMFVCRPLRLVDHTHKQSYRHRLHVR